jgi:hypothetical protein
MACFSNVGFSVIYAIVAINQLTVVITKDILLLQPIGDCPGLPSGVKFDPTDQQLIQHLQGKVGVENSTPHPLLDRFITTLEGEEGICYTHPERLPGSYYS